MTTNSVSAIGGVLAARSAPGAEGQRLAGASEASALGSTQSYCFTQPNGATAEKSTESTERRRRRWAARAVLWSASSLKAVRCCGRLLSNDGVGDPDDGQGVQIRRRESGGRAIASYGGLVTCGSVWACPRCSAVVAHSRAAEISSAVRECQRRGGSVYLLTLTMRHSAADKLQDLWDALNQGWRSSFGTRSWTGQRARTAERRGRLVDIPAVTGDAELFDVAGLTRVVEATYGAPASGGHGWHLHIHALVFTCSSLRAGLSDHLPVAVAETKVDNRWLGRHVFASRVHDRWSAGLRKAGYTMPGSVAIDIRELSDGGSDYVGRYLSKATYDAATRIGMEVGGGVLSKDAQVARNRSPFELLAGLADSLDARGFGVRTPRRWSVRPAGHGDWAVLDLDTGDVTAVTPPGEWRVWHEWEQASKGRRQITWSRRRGVSVSGRDELWNALLDTRGASADESDEDLAHQDCGGQVLGEIPRADWYRTVVWRPELVGRVLEVAENLGVDGLSAALAAEGVGFVSRLAPDGRTLPRPRDVRVGCGVASPSLPAPGARSGSPISGQHRWPG